MTEEQMKHLKVKKTLKIVGLIMLGIGLVCAITGFVNFFMVFGTGEMPRLFFLCFIGFPLIGVGGGLTLFGFKREITSFSVKETVPVINDVSKDISPAVRNITSAIRDGIHTADTTKCKVCGAYNKIGSKFCNECGSKIEG